MRPEARKDNTNFATDISQYTPQTLNSYLLIKISNKVTSIKKVFFSNFKRLKADFLLFTDNLLQCLRCDKHPSNTPTVPGTQTSKLWQYLLAPLSGTSSFHWPGLIPHKSLQCSNHQLGLS